MSQAELLIDAMGYLDDDLLEDAERIRFAHDAETTAKPRQTYSKPMRIAAIAAVCAMSVFGAYLFPRFFIRMGKESTASESAAVTLEAATEEAAAEEAPQMNEAAQYATTTEAKSEEAVTEGAIPEDAAQDEELQSAAATAEAGGSESYAADTEAGATEETIVTTEPAEAEVPQEISIETWSDANSRIVTADGNTYRPMTADEIEAIGDPTALLEKEHAAFDLEEGMTNTASLAGAMAHLFEAPEGSTDQGNVAVWLILEVEGIYYGFISE